MDNFFSPQIKETTGLTWTQIKILVISDKKRIDVHFYEFSQKETFFYTLKQQ